MRHLALPTGRLVLTLLAQAAAACALALPAQATLSATAYQNTIGQAQDINDSAEALATFGQARAHASRSQVVATAMGAGSGPQTHYGASAGSTSHYSLWDMARNLPVPLATAQQMELGFNFDLVGSVEVGRTVISLASTRYVGGVDYIGGKSNFQGTVSVSFANIFPFPAVGHTVGGDAGLFGAYARSFTARHKGAVDGVITFVVANTAGNEARASSSLTLSSVSLLGGAMLDGGLGVRIAETGLILPVSAVPEPGAPALWLAGGLAGLGLALRRRHVPAPGPAPA